MRSSAQSQISRASRRSHAQKFNPSPAIRQQVRKIIDENRSNIGSENNDMSKSFDRPHFKLGQTAETPHAAANGAVPLNVSKSVMLTTTDIPLRSNEPTQTGMEQTMVT